MTRDARGGDRAAITELLGGPATAWLVERVRRRIETSSDARALTGVVRLARPTPEQRDAAARLVGRPRRASTGLGVDLADVEEILRRGPWPAGLADAVVAVTGPVPDRRAEREAVSAAWAAAETGLAAQAARLPGLARWWDAWCGAGNLKRAAGAEVARRRRRTAERVPAHAVAAELVRETSAVLAELPTADEPLAVLARRVLGDAHGLDADRPLGRLAAAAVAAAFGRPEARAAADPDGNRLPSAREVWAGAGVVLSNVASTVLCFGVPGAGGGAAPGPTDRLGPAAATSAALEAMRRARVPLVLTLDQVRSGGVGALASSAVVHVCENPTVVEVAAARWAGAVSSDAAGPDEGNEPVLVCGWGQPSTAVVELLRVLSSGGARVRYHGDFDWAGLRIAQGLAARVPWEPWRFTGSDYRAALHGGEPSRPLTGTAAPSPWDPGLAAAMAELGCAVEEEAVADELAADLVVAAGGA